MPLLEVAVQEEKTWTEGGQWPLTDACGLKVFREENGREANQRRQAGGVPPIPGAVPVEDVDLGRLELDAGSDADHAAGPEGEKAESAEVLRPLRSPVPGPPLRNVV